MCLIWMREWRELRHRWPGGLALAGLAGAVAWWAPAQRALPALCAVAALAAAGGAAIRLWRERRSGGLGRLALTGLPPWQLLGARLGARVAATAAWLVPPAVLLNWRHPGSAGTAVLAVLGTIAAATAAGAAAGLRARSRWQVHQGALAAAALAWGLTWAAPAPAPAAPPPYAGAVALPEAGLPAGCAGAALVLLACWLAPRLLDSG